MNEFNQNDIVKFKDLLNKGIDADRAKRLIIQSKKPAQEKLTALNYLGGTTVQQPQIQQQPQQVQKTGITDFLKATPQYKTYEALKKTGTIAKEGIKRIGEAGKGLVEPVEGLGRTYTFPEAAARGAAGALQTAGSPIFGVIGQAGEDIINKIPDDIKQDIVENMEPTIEGVTNWWNKQTPEQQQNLRNIGVGLEVLSYYVGSGLIKNLKGKAYTPKTTIAPKPSYTGITPKAPVSPLAGGPVGQTLEQGIKQAPILGKQKTTIPTIIRNVVKRVEEGPKQFKGVVGQNPIIQPFREIKVKGVDIAKSDDLIQRGLRPSIVGKDTGAKIDIYKNKIREGIESAGKRKGIPKDGMDALNKVGESKKDIWKTIENNTALVNKKIPEQKIVDEIFKYLKTEEGLAATRVSDKLKTILTKEIEKYTTGKNINIKELLALKTAQNKKIPSNKWMEMLQTNQDKLLADSVVAKAMGKIYDDAIEEVLGGVNKGLMREYGSLRTLEKDLARRMGVFSRNTQDGIYGLTDVFTLPDMILGGFTGDVKQFLRGAGGRIVKSMIKSKENPNNIIKELFKLHTPKKPGFIEKAIGKEFRGIPKDITQGPVKPKIEVKKPVSKPIETKKVTKTPEKAKTPVKTKETTQKTVKQKEEVKKVETGIKKPEVKTTKGVKNKIETTPEVKVQEKLQSKALNKKVDELYKKGESEFHFKSKNEKGLYDIDDSVNEAYIKATADYGIVYNKYLGKFEILSEKGDVLGMLNKIGDGNYASKADILKLYRDALKLYINKTSPEKLIAKNQLGLTSIKKKILPKIGDKTKGQTKTTGVKPKSEVKTATTKKVETLPKDVTLEAEAKLVGAKRISPDRVTHQQLSPKEGIASVKKEYDDIIKTWDDFESKLDIRGGSQKKLDEYLQYKQGLKEGKYEGTRLRNIKRYVEDPRSVNYFKKLELKVKLKALLGRDYESLPKAIEKIKAYTDADIKKIYIDRVNKDISKGYLFPDEVLDYDKSFRTAINNRARYEKGVNTSFSADDARIVFDKRIKLGVKRQDGTIIPKNQIDEIVDGLDEFKTETGIDFEKMLKDDKVVIAHLNGKSPFLKNAGGLYREDVLGNKSLSIGGVERFTFKDKATGKMVTKTNNTVMAHEIGHAIDYKSGKKILKSIVPEAGRTFKKEGLELFSQSRGYWSKNTEIKARLIEQYVAVKKGNTAIYNRPGYWDKDTFKKFIPEIEKSFKENFSDYMVKTGVKGITNKGAYINPGKIVEDVKSAISTLNPKNIPTIAGKIAKQLGVEVKKVVPLLKGYVKKYGEQIKNKLADIFDDLADKLGVRAKLLASPSKKLQKAAEAMEKTKKTPAGISKADDLVSEAKKYKSADEFIKTHTKQEYRSAHQLSLNDSVTADKIDIPALKEAIRKRNGYLNNYVISDLKKLEKLQGNPEQIIKIYRTSPKQGLNSGDWITNDKSYASYIKKQNGGKVYSYDVKVKDLRFPNNMDDLPSLQMATTFNYGPNIDKLKDIWNKANKGIKKPKIIGNKLIKKPAGSGNKKGGTKPKK